MPRKVAVGMGIMEFPFSGAAAYWRWVDLLEAGGGDSLWQDRRLGRPPPILECMSVVGAAGGGRGRLAVADRPPGQPHPVPRMHERDGGARRTHAPAQIWGQRAVLGD